MRKLIFLLLLTGCSLKVAHFSDTHIKDTSSANYVSRVVEKINEQEPDFVLFTGDLTQNGTPKEFELAWGVLDKLEPPLYYVLGNHDYYLKAGKHNYNVSKFEDVYILTLDLVYGKNWLNAKYDTELIKEALTDVPTGSKLIALSHYPPINERKIECDYFSDYNLLLFAYGHYHSNYSEIRDSTLYSRTVSNNWRENHDTSRARGFKIYYLDDLSEKFIEVE